MNLLRYLRFHLPFPSMREYCERLGLPSARGWERLSSKLEEEGASSPERRQEIAVALDRIFQDVLVVGSRAVQLYRFSESEIRNIAEYFGNLIPETSPYLPEYPTPLTLSELTTVPAGNFLCEVRSDAHSVTLIFCRKRLVEEKELRSRNQIGDEAINRFGWQDYDEFVLIKRQCIQTYEAIRVDTVRGLLELRVDNGFPGDPSAALNELKGKANELLSVRFTNQLQLINPENLFPAIESMYSDASEGIVVELGFTTRTGSAKHEKMRAQGADLRNELYHVGGKNAIRGALTPFRVAIRWGTDGNRAAEEVLLPGSIRQLGGDNPFLSYLEVSGIGSEQRQQAIVERVVAHLPND